MAKQGMKRPDVTHVKPRNEAPPVPEIQGKAKSGKISANPIIAGTGSPSLKVFHTTAFPDKERPISDAYTAADTDLGRDNMENDMPEADLNNL